MEERGDFLKPWFGSLGLPRKVMNGKYTSVSDHHLTLYTTFSSNKRTVHTQYLRRPCRIPNRPSHIRDEVHHYPLYCGQTRTPSLHLIPTNPVLRVALDHQTNQEHYVQFQEPSRKHYAGISTIYSAISISPAVSTWSVGAAAGAAAEGSVPPLAFSFVK